MKIFMNCNFLTRFNGHQWIVKWTKKIIISVSQKLPKMLLIKGNNFDHYNKEIKIFVKKDLENYNIDCLKH